MLIRLRADANGSFACQDDNDTAEKTGLAQLKAAPLWHPADIRTRCAVTSQEMIAGQRCLCCQLPSGVASVRNSFNSHTQSI